MVTGVQKSEVNGFKYRISIARFEEKRIIIK